MFGFDDGRDVFAAKFGRLFVRIAVRVWVWIKRPVGVVRRIDIDLWRQPGRISYDGWGPIGGVDFVGINGFSGQYPPS